MGLFITYGFPKLEAQLPGQNGVRSLSYLHCPKKNKEEKGDLDEKI